MSLLFDVPHTETPVRMRFPLHKTTCVEQYDDTKTVRDEDVVSMNDAVEAARLDGMNEARQAAELELAHRFAQEREAVQVVCEKFAVAHEKYFAGMERAVVQLALSIAAKVIGREVAFDPLLLCGVVHVALQDVAAQDGVVLYVPMQDANAWRERLHGLTVEGDEELNSGDCRLESPLGVAELGVAAQVAEIEQGFFDLLAKRPA